MLELFVGLGFAISVGSVLAWILVWLLRIRPTDAELPGGNGSGPDHLSDEQLNRLLDGNHETGTAQDGEADEPPFDDDKQDRNR